MVRSTNGASRRGAALAGALLLGVALLDTAMGTSPGMVDAVLGVFGAVFIVASLKDD